MFACCIKGHSEIVKWLYKISNRRIDLKSRTNLIYSTISECGNLDIIKFLCEAEDLDSYEINELFKKNCTKGFIDIAKWLYITYINDICNIETLFVKCCGQNLRGAKYCYSLLEHTNLTEGFRNACTMNKIDVMNWIHSLDKVNSSVYSDYINASSSKDVLEWLYNVDNTIYESLVKLFHDCYLEDVDKLKWLYKLNVKHNITIDIKKNGCEMMKCICQYSDLEGAKWCYSLDEYSYKELQDVWNSIKIESRDHNVILNMMNWFCKITDNKIVFNINSLWKYFIHKNSKNGIDTMYNYIKKSVDKYVTTELFYECYYQNCTYSADFIFRHYLKRDIILNIWNTDFLEKLCEYAQYEIMKWIYKMCKIIRKPFIITIKMLIFCGQKSSIRILNLLYKHMCKTKENILYDNIDKLFLLSCKDSYQWYTEWLYHIANKHKQLNENSFRYGFHMCIVNQKEDTAKWIVSICQHKGWKIECYHFKKAFKQIADIVAPDKYLYGHSERYKRMEQIYYESNKYGVPIDLNYFTSNFSSACISNNFKYLNWIYNFGKKINCPINLQYDNNKFFKNGCIDNSVEICEWLYEKCKSDGTPIDIREIIDKDVFIILHKVGNLEIIKWLANKNLLYDKINIVTQN